MTGVVILPKTLLAALLTAAREVAEMHDADEQPADYAEARLLRAVEAVEALACSHEPVCATTDMHRDRART